MVAASRMTAMTDLTTDLTAALEAVERGTSDQACDNPIAIHRAIAFLRTHGKELARLAHLETDNAHE